MSSSHNNRHITIFTELKKTYETVWLGVLTYDFLCKNTSVFTQLFTLKNIPISSNRSCKLQLMDKIEQVTKHMGWKAFFYINPSGENMKQTYGLKTLNCPPKIKEMVSFE